ncbi:MAG: FkbM family methyltransferase [Actinomycetia bacterium]|nr:FkbM family methyltransferase [Actinomycetes bacterium]
MSFRDEIKSRLSATLRWPVTRHFPQGIYFARDFGRFFRELEIENIFDVGAHHGESAIEYAALFPHARIDSFEPVRESFIELQRRTSRNPRVHCHNFALGSRSENSKMDTTAGYSSSFKISKDGNEKVTIKTAVDFCRQHHIDRVNFLKIDTEGFDLEVLRGAEPLIENRDIDLIQVEAGMNPENNFHVYFEHFTSYLHKYGYRIFGIYEQVSEPLARSAKLRRSNIIFASPSLTRIVHG